MLSTENKISMEIPASNGVVVAGSGGLNVTIIWESKCKITKSANAINEDFDL
jgi:hypothetical protein